MAEERVSLNTVLAVGCEACHPLLSREGVARSETFGPQHIAARFGDRHYRVVVDGEDVTERCFEAIAGEPGWAWLLQIKADGKFYPCMACGRGEFASAELLEGTVVAEPLPLK